MSNIAIYGTGGFGREVRQLIDQINQHNHIWDFVGYFDDFLDTGTNINGFPVLGGINQLNNYEEELSLVIAIGTPQVVENIFIKLGNPKINFPNLIHPSVCYDTLYNQIGNGNIISFGCHFTCDIRIGSFNIFNTRATLGHDVKVGSFNLFQPNVQISGEVVIGNTNFFGVNSCVLQRKNIGNNNKLGAGSLLMRSVKDNGSYFGNPAYEMKL